MFIIEDEAHAEPQGEFVTFDAAMAELKRRAVKRRDLQVLMAALSAATIRLTCAVALQTSPRAWPVAKTLEALNPCVGRLPAEPARSR